MNNPIQQQLEKFDEEFKCECMLCKEAKHKFSTTHSYMKEYLSSSMELAYKAGLEASVIGEGHMKAWKKIAREETLREVLKVFEDEKYQCGKHKRFVSFLINNITKK